MRGRFWVQKERSYISALVVWWLYSCVYVFSGGISTRVYSLRMSLSCIFGGMFLRASLAPLLDIQIVRPLEA